MNAKESTKTINVDVLKLMLDENRIAVLKIKSGFFEQADLVASNLREADYNEVYRSSGKCPRSLVNLAWKKSCLKWIIFFEKEPVALFGVFDRGNRTGDPWMVATDNFHDPDMELYFARNCRKYVEMFFRCSDFLMLSNCIDVDNTKSIRWLKWCGFKMGDIIKYGPFEKPFIRFSMPRRVH